MLQSANLELVKAVELNETVTVQLEEMRLDPSSFDPMWDEVEKSSTAQGFDISECRPSRKRRISIKLQEFVVVDSIGKQTGSTHFDFSVKHDFTFSTLL